MVNGLSEGEMYDRLTTSLWFSLFKEHTNQKVETAKHILRGSGKHSPCLTQHLRYDGSRPVDKAGYAIITDFGAGAGEIFLPVIARLPTLFPLSRGYCVCEPSVRMSSLFFRTFLDADFSHDTLSDLVEGVDRDGNIVSPRKNSSALAICSHVLYYTPDLRKSLRAIYETLAPGGAACIFLSSKDSALHALRSEFFPKLNGHNSITGEDVANLLEEMGIPCNLEYMNSSVDVTDCLTNPEGQHGTGILSFFLRHNFSSLTQQDRERVLRVLKERSHRKPIPNEYFEPNHWGVYNLRINQRLPPSFSCGNEHTRLYQEVNHMTLHDAVIWITKPGELLRQDPPPYYEGLEYLLDPGSEVFDKLFRERIARHVVDDLSEKEREFLSVYASLLAYDMYASDFYYSELAKFEKCNAKLSEAGSTEDRARILNRFRYTIAEGTETEILERIVEVQRALDQEKKTRTGCIDTYWLDHTYPRDIAERGGKDMKVMGKSDFVAMLAGLYQKYQHHVELFYHQKSLFLDMVRERFPSALAVPV